MAIIYTRYLGPTDTKGSRIKAYSHSKSVTVARRYELSSQNNHLRAVQQFAAKVLGWHDVNARLLDEAQDGRGYVYEILKL